MYILVSTGCHNKIPQAGCLKQQRFIFSQFWRLEGPRSRRPQGLVPGKDFPPGLQTATFLPCPPMAIEREGGSALVSLPFADVNLVGAGLHLMTSFNLYYFLLQIQSHWGLGLQCMSLRRTQFSPWHV